MHTDTDTLAGTRARKGHEDPEVYAGYVRRLRDRADRKDAALREALDLIAARGVTMPDISTFDFEDTIRLKWDCPDQDAFRAVVRALGSTVDNPWIKSTSGGSYRLERRHGAHLDLTVRATWGTCEQIQVGTKVETKTEVVRPAETREVVAEVPVYEWRCPDSVMLSELDDAAGDSPTVGELDA